MSKSFGLCGLILSAGQSSRMGSDKALLPWPPNKSALTVQETFLSANIKALQSLTDKVLVVVGRNKERLVSIIQAADASMVENSDPDRGQFSSLRVGLDEVLRLEFSAAMIFPIDSPPLAHPSLEKLYFTFIKARERDIWGVAPKNGDKRGHPLLAGRELIEAFLDAPANSNARQVRNDCSGNIEYVEIADPFVGLNVNTPEEYAELCKLVEDRQYQA